MKVKASLHLHSCEDIEDGVIIDYSIFQLIDRLAELGFQAIASTCHYRGICTPEHIDYARGKGLLLIPGVEREIEGHKHLLILNCGPEADGIKTFEQLEEFRRVHPESFIIAPHPNHGRKLSLGLKNLRKYSGLFDAVENSWFYGRFINPNRAAARLSDELGKPFISTADAHTLQYLETDYAVIETEELTSEALFAAIRGGKFENVSRPKTLLALASFIIMLKFRKLRSYFRQQKSYG